MKKIFLFAFVLCLIACNKKQAIPEAMYFWKTNLSFSKSDKAFLKEHAVKKIYVRYCDVGLRDEQAVPIAPIEIDTLSTRGLAIVPVIYIKNEVFDDIATAQYAPQRFWGTETLSENVAKYIEQINNYYHLTVNEVQFDCDWTLNTKEYYFNFLKLFKEKNPDFIFLETGLGGRYDATNIVKSTIAAITNVSFDHIALLGNSLEKIADRKAADEEIKTSIANITTNGNTAEL